MILKISLRSLKTMLVSVGFIGIFFACENAKKDKELKLSKGTEIHSKTDTVEVKETSLYLVEGKKVYDQYCMVCHQVTGDGVQRLNPPLDGSEYVLGNKAALLDIIINGSNKGLTVKGETYANAMPPFSSLHDQEIADVASYIRNSFGNSATAIAVEEVIAFRSNSKE